MAIADALGYLVRFVILPGQVHDFAGMRALLQDLGYGTLIGDIAFDAAWLLEEIERSEAMAAIPLHRFRAQSRNHDRWRCMGW